MKEKGDSRHPRRLKLIHALTQVQHTGTACLRTCAHFSCILQNGPGCKQIMQAAGSFLSGSAWGGSSAGEGARQHHDTLSWAEAGGRNMAERDRERRLAHEGGSLSDHHNKRAGYKVIPGLTMASPTWLETVRYLFVVPVLAGAFVLGGVWVPESLLQPVSRAPTTRPSNTIRVYVLFIGDSSFSQIGAKHKENLRSTRGNYRARTTTVAGASSSASALRVILPGTPVGRRITRQRPWKVFRSGAWKLAGSQGLPFPVAASSPWPVVVKRTVTSGVEVS